MSGRGWALGAGAATMTFGLGLLLGARLAAPKETPLVPPATVSARSVPNLPAHGGDRGFTGVVFPHQQVDLESTVEARVATVEVALGDRVHKGQTIATLDAESIRRELAQAVAAVRGAQAEVRSARLEQAAANAKAMRLGKLGDAVAEEELETARYQEQLAGARVEAARARVSESLATVEKLRTLIGNTAIAATFDGVVAQRYKDPGAIVGPGRPIIRLISGDDVWVRFAVPEAQVGEISVRGCVDASVPTLGLSAQGVIETVAPQIDAAARMLFVEARLTLPAAWQGRLPVGLEAHVRARTCAPDPG